MFRHEQRMHHKSRNSEILIIENIPRTEIEKIKINTSSQISIIDYDTMNEDNCSVEDFLYKTIKKYYLLNLFLVICSSFNVVKFPNLLELNNKSCVQFIKIKRISFSNFLNVFSKPYNTIHFFISKEIMNFKCYLNKQKYKNYLRNKDIIIPCLKTINNSYCYNKVFVQHCLNLPPDTFFCFYQILKNFIFYSNTVFFTDLKTPRFVFSKKRAKQNSSPLPNVYKIPLIIFNNLLKFFPKTVNFNFNKVFNVKPLNKKRLSIEYAYYSIYQIDSCMAQMSIADKFFANTNIQFCSNKSSVFDHVFNKIKHKTEMSSNLVVNLYSKRYILNKFTTEYYPNKRNCITLNEFLILRKFLMNNQSINEIKFKIFLDKFKQIYLNTISKKYVNNLKKVVKPMSKYDFIKSFNLQFKQTNKQDDYLESKNNKIEYINNYSYDLKYLFEEHKPQIKSEHSILNKTTKINYFKTRNDFIQFNRTQLKQLCIQGTLLECECNLQMNKVKKLCDDSWMSYSTILNSYLSKTFLLRKIKSNCIKIHILQTAYKHLNCCLTKKQFDFIYTQTKVVDSTWKECVLLLDKKIKTIIV